MVTVRVATRGSDLALAQAHFVAGRITRELGRETELVVIKTTGDRIQNVSLAKIGGKGLFVKELEQGMLNGQADIAVHSMKDVPVDLPEGLHLAVIMRREDPRDAFVSNQYDSLVTLPQGAMLGTASLRRECQLRERRPDLRIEPLRGNINTRLGRLDEGRYDAIVLASSGMKRMGFGERIRCIFTPEQSLPAIGQGALGIECRVEDDRVNELVSVLGDADTTACVLAERALNRGLHGGCQVPIAGYAELAGGQIHLRGLVGEPDGSRVIRVAGQAPAAEGGALGERLAGQLQSQGADAILKRLYEQP